MNYNKLNHTKKAGAMFAGDLLAGNVLAGCSTVDSCKKPEAPVSTPQAEVAPKKVAPEVTAEMARRAADMTLDHLY